MKTQGFIKEITVDPTVRFGRPVIRGTRVPVDLIVGRMAEGMSVEEVMKEYDLNRLQIFAALKYAATIVAEEDIVFT